MGDNPSADPLKRNMSAYMPNLSETRYTKKTLGMGSFGRVNLEATETGNVATKYFLDPTKTFDNITEIAVLKYLRGYPNVTQLISVEKKPAGFLLNAVAPSEAITEDLAFPAVVMGKAHKSLYDVVKDNEITGWDELFNIITQVIKGVTLLHNVNIAHRDIKPANMLITSEKEVWITDFGKSKYIPENVYPIPLDGYTGTLNFTSIELLLAKYTGVTILTDFFKSDCWAVGVSLYYLLTGQKLFTGETIGDRISSIFNILGKPVHGDGVVRDLYNIYKSSTNLPLPTRSKAESTLKSLILTNTIHKPADITILERLADTIVNLFVYNPDRRIFLGTLYFSGLFDYSLPLHIPTKELYDQYAISPLVNDITQLLLSKHFEYLILFVYHNEYLFNEKAVPFLLDRAGAYTFMFINEYKKHSICNSTNLLAIELVALHIAYALFNNGKRNEFTIEMIKKVTSTRYTNKLIDDILSMFMISNIQFLGKTFLDNVLDDAENIEDEENRDKLETFAFLNYSFYHYNMFHRIEDRESMILQMQSFIDGEESYPFFTELTPIINENTINDTINTFYRYYIYYRVTTSAADVLEGGGKKKRKTMTRKKRKTRKHKK